MKAGRRNDGGCQIEQDEWKYEKEEGEDNQFKVTNM